MGTRAAAVVAGAVLVGAGWGGVRRPDPAVLAPLDGRSVAFHAVAAGDPRVSSFGWGVEAVVGRVDGAPARIRVWVQGRARPPPVEPGSRIEGHGILEVLRPGDGGFQDHLVGRGVLAFLSAHRMVVGPARAGLALAAANAARRAVRRGAEVALPPPDAGLLLGLAIGDVSSMDPEIEEDFRATGLGHLVAVSGSNVVMVLAPVLAAVGMLGGGAWARVAVGTAAVVLFALITRWEPSVLRASVMAVLALLGMLAGRPRSASTVLAGAVLILLVADPGLSRSLGFQLSVAATGGLVALAGPLAERMPWIPRPVALALAATLGAQVAVTPLLLLRFGMVPLATVPANLLAVPLTAPALLLGLLAAVVALLSPALGSLLGRVAAAPLDLMMATADHTAKAGFPVITSRGVVLPVVAAAGAVALVWRLRRGRRLRRATVALLAAMVLWVAGAGSARPSTVTVTFFDVGQGDAALVRAPDGVNVLIDAGPGHGAVAARLAALGVRRLDVVVASHAHADHVEGLPTVLARHPVSLLLDPRCPGDSPSYRSFLRAAAAEGVPVRRARGGQRFRVGALLIEVLGPDGCRLGDGPNDDSVVLRITGGGRRVLFPGDAEVPAQQDLLDDGDPVQADVLKVPHHGGDTSLEGFFAAVGAGLAVVSTGENTYGHPVPGVLAALRAAGMDIVRTDRAGEVTVELTPGRIVVRSER
jgi:competence protein ComEC